MSLLVFALLLVVAGSANVYCWLRAAYWARRWQRAIEDRRRILSELRRYEP